MANMEELRRLVKRKLSEAADELIEIFSQSLMEYRIQNQAELQAPGASLESVTCQENPVETFHEPVMISSVLIKQEPEEVQNIWQPQIEEYQMEVMTCPESLPCVDQSSSLHFNIKQELNDAANHRDDDQVVLDLPNFSTDEEPDGSPEADPKEAKRKARKASAEASGRSGSEHTANSSDDTDDSEDETPAAAAAEPVGKPPPAEPVGKPAEPIRAPADDDKTSDSSDSEDFSEKSRQLPDASAKPSPKRRKVCESRKPSRPTFSCPVCKKQFIYQTSLHRHVNTHRAQTNKQGDKKPPDGEARS